MEHVINAQKRTISTKAVVNDMRRNGKIPGVVYGNHKESTPIVINVQEFKKVFLIFLKVPLSL